jgi:hypothetical protein
MVLDPTLIRGERKLGQVCSEEEYTKVFDRLSTLPPGVEHLIIQLGDASPSVTVTPSETECLHRDSDCLSPHGVFGERVVIKTQSFCFIGEVGIFRYKRVCEQI